MASAPRTASQPGWWFLLAGLASTAAVAGTACGAPAGETTGEQLPEAGGESSLGFEEFEAQPGKTGRSAGGAGPELESAVPPLKPGPDSGPEASAGEAGPGEPVPEPEIPEALVFVQFTDIHQSRGGHSDKGHYDNWYRSLAYVHDVVEPAFVVATGDLTDGSGPGNNQRVEQWEDYRQAIDDAGFTSANFHDLPGNHDGLGPDSGFAYYRRYGVSGATMHAWHQDQGEARQLFLALLTAEPGATEGGFTGSSAAWAASQLEREEVNHLVLFAHHNHWILGFGAPPSLVGPSGLVARHEATAFVAGHRHLDWEHTVEGTRYLVTAHHYKGMPGSDAGWMRLFAIWGDSWATKTCYVVDHGPQVIIVSPQDRRLAVTRNPTGHEVGPRFTVEALAFGQPPPRLRARLDDGPAYPMAAEGRWHRLTLDLAGAAPGRHRLRVEAMPLTDETNGADEITLVTY